MFTCTCPYMCDVLMLVRDRVEKLEQLVAERNSVEMTQQELATPSSATVEFAGSPNTSSTAPFKKKTKNCELEYSPFHHLINSP